MTSAYLIAAIAVLFIVCMWIAIYIGGERQKRKEAERIAKEQQHDNEIASEPFVDRPFGAMRPKD